MDRLAAALVSALIVLSAACVWRLWVLGRNVREAGDRAQAARAGLTRGADAGGTPATVYPLRVHAEEAARLVTVGLEGGDAQAVPLVLRRGPESDALAGMVAAGAVTHLLVSTVLMRVHPAHAVDARGWASPDEGAHVLMGTREPDADRFPLAATGEASPLSLPVDDGPYSTVLAMAL